MEFAFPTQTLHVSSLPDTPPVVLPGDPATLQTGVAHEGVEVPIPIDVCGNRPTGLNEIIADDVFGPGGMIILVPNHIPAHNPSVE